MRINRERGATFARYVGLELKGAIVARGFSAKAVAAVIERGDANLNRWLNGKIEIPISVVCEVAEAIGIDPGQLVQTAYDRMVVELGGADGTTYDKALKSSLRQLNVGRRPSTDREKVPLDATLIAASTDNSTIDPSCGEA